MLREDTFAENLPTGVNKQTEHSLQILQSGVDCGRSRLQFSRSTVVQIRQHHNPCMRSCASRPSAQNL
jgi:hypothetical protein